MKVSEEYNRRIKKCVDTMAKLGMFERGWTFHVNFNQTRGRNLGRCHSRRKQITLSIRGFSDSDFHQTLLHEIAHALVFELRGTCSPEGEGAHGPTFIAMCALLKCDHRPRRNDTEVRADIVLREVAS